MTDDTRKLAAAVVDRIIADISDRRGLGDAWEEIDEATQAEIRKLWRSIVVRHLRPAKKP